MHSEQLSKTVTDKLRSRKDARTRTYEGANFTTSYKRYSGGREITMGFDCKGMNKTR